MNGFREPGSDFLRGQLRWKALHVLPLIDCLMRPLSHCSVSLIKKFAPFCFSGCNLKNCALVFVLLWWSWVYMWPYIQFIISSSSPSEIGSIVHKFPRWMMNVFWSLEKLQQSRNSDETRFNFSKQSTWKTWQTGIKLFQAHATEHGTWQTRPKANTNLTFPNTCHSTWHMANTAQSKHVFNF